MFRYSLIDRYIVEEKGNWLEIKLRRSRTESDPGR